MRKVIGGLFVAASVVTSGVTLAEGDAYVSIGVGGGLQNMGDKPIIGNWDTSNKSFVANLAGGYAFTENVAAEFGVMGYFGGTVENKTQSRDIKLNTYSLDLLAKLSAPVSDEVTVFGKAGFAYVTNKRPKSSNGTTTGKLESETKRSFAPKFAAGVGYKFMPEGAVELTYSFIPGKSDVRKSFDDNNKFRPALHALTVGITYSLG